MVIFIIMYPIICSYSRLSGEDGQQYHAVIVKHFPRLGKIIQVSLLISVCP